MRSSYNNQDKRPAWKQKLKPLNGYNNGSAKYIPEEVPGAIYSTGKALIVYDDEFNIANVSIQKGKEFPSVATYVPGLGLIPGNACNQKNALIADNALANMLGSDTIDSKFRTSLQYIKDGLAEKFDYPNNGYHKNNGGKK